MDIDDEDDFYAPEEPQTPATAPAAQPTPTTTAPATKNDANEELEEGEEEDEGGEMDEDDDSDIDIITERKDDSKPAPPPQSRYSEIKNIPQRSTTNDTSTKPPRQKREEPRQSVTEQPPVSTSKIDVNAIPIHRPTGKPLTQVNIDEDLADHDKPWRKPGTDLSDYFNYGFDEFTWALYASKQEELRGAYNADTVAQNSKKMMEEWTNMMMMGGMMPGVPGAGAPVPAGGAGGVAAGAGGGAGGGVGGSSAMDGMTPEMQAAMMQQMMASGMDPSQMDMNAMAAMYQGGMQNQGGGGAGGQGGQGQGFGAGYGGNQGQGGYGYDQQMGGGGGGRGGRGRGRRW